MGMTPLKKTALNRTAGRSLARLIKLVLRTSKISYDPPTLKDDLKAAHPVILAVWHGQFMLTCHLDPGDVKVSAMVARHGDAELIGEAMAAFGVDLIRGAGAGERKKDRGGAYALRAAVSALDGRADRAPSTVVMTADVPPGPARRAGEGIITIARLSGRPIVPVAAASSRYKAFRTWSRMTVNLPFSKIAFTAGPAIFVPRDADPAALESLRCELEKLLNTLTDRAYALVGADPSAATPPHAAGRPARPGVALKTYAAVTNAARILTGSILRYRQRQGKEDAARLGERRGRAGLPRPEGPLVWVHAASVGEMNAVLPLIVQLLAARPDLHVLLTTTTVSSAQIARQTLPPRARHQFLPLDATAYASAFLRHWSPQLAVFTESEIWPSLILETSQRGIPLALVNGRLSPKSHKRWTQLPSLSEPLFSRFDVILAQNEKLARWFRDVGGRQVIPAGNLKADSPPLPVDAAKRARLLEQLGTRPRLLVASTHDGEDAIVGQAQLRLAARLPGFCTLLVPRHPERGAAIAQELTALGLTVARRALDEPVTPDVGIYIADTLGELGTLFTTCPLALIAGSLVDRGGHNPIEAVTLGCAVLSGPSTHNFRDEYAALSHAQGVAFVSDAASLAETVERLLADPAALSALTQHATLAVEGLKGALPRTLATLVAMLPPPAAIAPQDPAVVESVARLQRAS
jgi:3-deoxy-D-manno-octulosonic-acid transferase